MDTASAGRRYAGNRDASAAASSSSNGKSNVSHALRAPITFRSEPAVALINGHRVCWQAIRRESRRERGSVEFLERQIERLARATRADHVQIGTRRRLDKWTPRLLAGDTPGIETRARQRRVPRTANRTSRTRYARRSRSDRNPPSP